MHSASDDNQRILTNPSITAGDKWVFPFVHCVNPPTFNATVRMPVKIVRLSFSPNAGTKTGGNGFGILCVESCSFDNAKISHRACSKNRNRTQSHQQIGRMEKTMATLAQFTFMNDEGRWQKRTDQEKSLRIRDVRFQCCICFPR